MLHVSCCTFVLLLKLGAFEKARLRQVHLWSFPGGGAWVFRRGVWLGTPEGFLCGTPSG